MFATTQLSLRKGLVTFLGNMTKYYAVRVGRVPGVYTSWPQAEEQVKKFTGAVHKSFPTEREAQDYVFESDLAREIRESMNDVPTTITVVPKKSSNRTKRVTKEIPIAKEEKKRKHSDEDEAPSTKRIRLDENLIIYTDGSCLDNGKPTARAGVGVYFGENDPRNISEKFTDGKPSNQRAEVKAAIRALETVDEGQKVTIKTDSKYLINAMTKWRQTWEKNGWLTSTKEPVLNTDLFHALIEIIEGRSGELIWEYVPGHKGHAGNEAADQLAVAGANM